MWSYVKHSRDSRRIIQTYFASTAIVYGDAWRMVYVCQPVIGSWVATSPRTGGPTELADDPGVGLYTRVVNERNSFTQTAMHVLF